MNRKIFSLIGILIFISLGLVSAHADDDDFGSHMMGDWMMGSSGAWGAFGLIFAILVIVAMVLLIVWMIKQIQKK